MGLGRDVDFGRVMLSLLGLMIGGGVISNFW